MEWVEFRATTVELAKESALDALHIDESEAEFEILEEPRKGIFGRMKGEARVRARISPVVPRPKVERRDKRRRPPSTTGEQTVAGDSSSADHGQVDARSARSSLGGDATRSRSPAGAERSSREQKAETSRRPRALGPTRHGGGSEDPSVAVPEGRAAREQETVMTSNNLEHRASPDQEPANPAAELAAAEAFLDGLVKSFGFESRIEVVESEDARELRVHGAELGLLVGPKGATLDAVQELTRLAARKVGPARSETRLRVDVAGYRERRRAALVRFALAVAEDVVRTGTQKALEPMSAADRKTVHDAVTDLPNVSTTSEGEEPRRRVVILPR